MARVLEFFASATTRGDLNDDGQLDCSDMAILSAFVQIGVYAAQYDMNQDGTLSHSDILYWVTELKGTLVGDANLDGLVDVSDYNVWNSHRFEFPTFWCTADFNGDQITDVSDFNLWNQYKFQSAGQLTSRATGLRGSNVSSSQPVPHTPRNLREWLQPAPMVAQSVAAAAVPNSRLARVKAELAEETSRCHRPDRPAAEQAVIDSIFQGWQK